MPRVFLHDVARPLLLAHGLCGIVASASALHLLVLTLHARRHAPQRQALLALHARVVAVSTTLCFALGLLLYPGYRVFVRGLVLDVDSPALSNLFDFKEAMALVALPLALVLPAVARAVGRGDNVIDVLRWFVLVLALVTLGCAGVGAWVTSVKGP